MQRFTWLKLGVAAMFSCVSDVDLSGARDSNRLSLFVWAVVFEIDGVSLTLARCDKTHHGGSSSASGGLSDCDWLDKTKDNFHSRAISSQVLCRLSLNVPSCCTFETINDAIIPTFLMDSVTFCTSKPIL